MGRNAYNESPRHTQGLTVGEGGSSGGGSGHGGGEGRNARLFTAGTYGNWGTSNVNPNDRMPTGSRYLAAGPKGPGYYVNPNFASGRAPTPQQQQQPTAMHSPAPTGFHGDSGGDFASAMMAMMEMYNTMIDKFLGEGLEPGASEADGGAGFEDTVLTRRVIGEDTGGSMYDLRQGPATPASQVIDPITGTVYASAAAALRAGVTNYTYKAGPTPSPATAPATAAA